MKKYLVRLCRTQRCCAEVEVAADDIGASRVLADALAADPDRLAWQASEESVEVESLQRAKEPR